MERRGPTDLSFEDLLRLARGGDRPALQALFQRSRPSLQRSASRHVTKSHPGGARPSDLAQETAERILRNIASFTGATEAEWFAWLESLSRSRAVQSVRDARRKKRAIPGGLPLDAPEAMAAPSPRTSPSQTASNKQQGRLLLGFLHELPEDQREAIRLRYLEDLPVLAVARQMTRTEASVNGLLRRALAALQSRFVGGELGLVEQIRALRPAGHGDRRK